MVYMNNKECKEIIANCCRITRLELSRWSGKQLSNSDLESHYDLNNWTRISQGTTKAITTRGYRFNQSGLRVEGIVVSNHSGYSVSIHLWAPMTKIGEPDAPCFGPFEK